MFHLQCFAAWRHQPSDRHRLSVRICIGSTSIPNCPHAPAPSTARQRLQRDFKHTFPPPPPPPPASAHCIADSVRPLLPHLQPNPPTRPHASSTPPTSSPPSRFPLPDLELNPLPPNTWSRVKYRPLSSTGSACPVPPPRSGHTLLLRPKERALYLFGGQQVHACV